MSPLPALPAAILWNPVTHSNVIQIWQHILKLPSRHVSIFSSLNGSHESILQCTKPRWTLTPDCISSTPLERCRPRAQVTDGIRTKYSAPTFTHASAIPTSIRQAPAAFGSRRRTVHRNRSRSATPTRARHVAETPWSAHTSDIGRNSWHACSRSNGSSLRVELHKSRSAHASIEYDHKSTDKEGSTWQQIMPKNVNLYFKRKQRF